MKRHPLRTLLPASLGIGTLDLLFAWGYWARNEVSPVDILQSIAAGWYGRASYQMGTASAVVGALSHYAIMFVVVLVYWFMAKRITALRTHAWIPGLAYGLAVYGVMSFVVLPLSAAGNPDLGNTPWVVASVAMHLLIGVLCALAARHALR